MCSYIYISVNIYIMYTFLDEAVSFNFFIKKGNIPFVFHMNKSSETYICS